MLLQSLLLIATLIIVGSALLTSTLASAKTAFHHSVQMKSEAAMVEATADLVTWAQDHVRTDGIDQTPVWSAKPQQEPLQAACAPAATDQLSPSMPTCNLYEKIAWNVTGYTGDAQNGGATTSLSQANELATAQNEQRVSATINVAITDKTGNIVYANHSREVTARLFHAFPYIAITASKDVSSASGDNRSSEGDSAGNASRTLSSPTTLQTPSAEQPSEYSNTLITTTINCVNTARNNSPNAMNDNNAVSYSPIRAYGNVAWVYEVPCNPSQRINAKTLPREYTPPDGTVYADESAADASWSKHDENDSTFSR